MLNGKKQRAADAATLRWIGRSIIILAAEVEQMAPGQRKSDRMYLLGIATMLQAIGKKLAAWGQ